MRSYPIGENVHARLKLTLVEDAGDLGEDTSLFTKNVRIAGIPNAGDFIRDEHDLSLELEVKHVIFVTHRPQSCSPEILVVLNRISTIHVTPRRLEDAKWKPQ